MSERASGERERIERLATSGGGRRVRFDRWIVAGHRRIAVWRVMPHLRARVGELWSERERALFRAIGRREA